jgi:hypothetical protein
MTLEDVNDACASHLATIATYFKPGAKLCLTVRFPGLPERDFLLTDDALPEVVAMLTRRMEQAARAAMEGKSDG